MKNATWKDVAELVGIAAIVASLVFVGLQMQQQQEIAITETRSSVTQSIGDLAMMIEAAPDVWRKGLDGDELSQDESIVFYAMAEAAESHIFNMFLRFGRLGISEPEVHAENYAYALYVYPGLKESYIQENEYVIGRRSALQRTQAADNRFRSLVLENLMNLESARPPKPTHRSYVFW